MLYVPLTLLALAAVLDLRDREIPDWLSLTLLGWAVVQWAVGLAPASTGMLLAGLGAGLLVFLAMMLFGGFGGGDAKLLVALGPVLGLALYLQLLFTIALAGGLLALFALLREQRDLAYAPAIAIGMLVLTLWHGGGVRL